MTHKLFHHVWRHSMRLFTYVNEQCKIQSNADEELPKGSVSAAMVSHHCIGDPTAMVAQQVPVKMHDDDARWVLPKKPHRAALSLPSLSLWQSLSLSLPLSLSLAGERGKSSCRESHRGIAICLRVTSRERQQGAAN